MDEDRARSLLESMTAWDQIPVLTAEQVDSLVILAQRSDPVSGDTSWDLNAAAAEGWLWKAAAVSGSFDFVSDSQRFDRSQMAEMCLTMAGRYRRRLLTSVFIPGSTPGLNTLVPEEMLP